MNRESKLDRINRVAWTSRDALREFTLEKRYTDPGEEAAFTWLTPRCMGQPLLDIGVGAGRTIPLMKSISQDYVGIDYTEKLIQLARKQHPGTDLRHMDARDMRELPSDHYGLVAFSWNGIDAVDYEGRQQILREMYRVVRPGGYVFFSSHNRDGPGYGETIWKLLPRFTSNPVRLGWRVARSLTRLPVAGFNYMRNAPLNHDFDGYSIMTAAAHNFGIVMVYTTLEGQRQQLAEIGFENDVVFGSCEGDRIPHTAKTSDAWWLHFIARRPHAAS